MERLDDGPDFLILQFRHDVGTAVWANMGSPIRLPKTLSAIGFHLDELYSQALLPSRFSRQNLGLSRRTPYSPPLDRGYSRPQSIDNKGFPEKAF